MKASKKGSHSTPHGAPQQHSSARSPVGSDEGSTLATVGKKVANIASSGPQYHHDPTPDAPQWGRAGTTTSPAVIHISSDDGEGKRGRGGSGTSSKTVVEQLQECLGVSLHSAAITKEVSTQKKQSNSKKSLRSRGESSSSSSGSLIPSQHDDSQRAPSSLAPSRAGTNLTSDHSSYSHAGESESLSQRHDDEEDDDQEFSQLTQEIFSRPVKKPPVSVGGDYDEGMRPTNNEKEEFAIDNRNKCHSDANKQQHLLAQEDSTSSSSSLPQQQAPQDDSVILEVTLSDGVKQFLLIPGGSSMSQQELLAQVTKQTGGVAQLDHHHHHPDVATPSTSSLSSDANNSKGLVAPVPPDAITPLIQEAISLEQTATGKKILRSRFGTNVHEVLGGHCPFRAYRPGSRKQRPIAAGPHTQLQLIPLLMENFPSELGNQVAEIFQDVIALVCGSVGGSVESTEVRSPTSYIVLVRTSVVYHLIYNLRSRVLMDRHGFWYAEDMNQYAFMKKYCDSLNALPFDQRRAKIDGLPTSPLMLELAKTVDPSQIVAPTAPTPFDKIAPTEDTSSNLRFMAQQFQQQQRPQQQGAMALQLARPVDPRQPSVVTVSSADPQGLAAFIQGGGSLSQFSQGGGASVGPMRGNPQQQIVVIQQAPPPPPPQQQSMFLQQQHHHHRNFFQPMLVQHQQQNQQSPWQNTYVLRAPPTAPQPQFRFAGNGGDVGAFY